MSYGAQTGLLSTLSTHSTRAGQKPHFTQVGEGGFGFTDEKPTFHMRFWSKNPFELGRYSQGALLHGCAPYGLGLNPNWISLFN